MFTTFDPLNLNWLVPAEEVYMTEWLLKSITPLFTQRLWSAIEPIYQSICRHPFIIELAEGTLNTNRFVFYLQQDALYLADFSRALAQSP